MKKFGLDLTTATDTALDDLWTLVSDYLDSKPFAIDSAFILLKDELDAETDRRDKLKQANLKLPI